MEIKKRMIGYFVYGLNALVDNGENITFEKAYKLVENKQLISYIYEKYGNEFWEFHCLLKYEEDLCSKLFNYGHYIDEDHYRKFGIDNNGFIILSSVATLLVLEQ